MKRTLNQKKAINLLKENGLDSDSGRQAPGQGDQTGYRPITLPQHKGRDYPPVLALAILKQAELR